MKMIVFWNQSLVVVVVVNVCFHFTMYTYLNNYNTLSENIKGVFSNSNMFLLHKSVDCYKKKSLFPKSQLLPILHLQVRHDYVHSIVPMEHCVELVLVDETSCKKQNKKWSHFIRKWFQRNSFWGNALLRGELQIDAINSNFEKFTCALYMKSVSMSLTGNITVHTKCVWGNGQV